MQKKTRRFERTAASVCKEYAILTLATLVMSAGTYLFKFPNNFSFGGVTGLAVDLLIAVSACFVFDITTGLFSLCGLFTKTIVIDTAIENINLCKYFTIVCKDPTPICDFIHTELGRSATLFTAEGTYSGQEEYIVLTVMKRSQAVQLRNYIKKVQPQAFMMITNSSEIIGKGFRNTI